MHKFQNSLIAQIVDWKPYAYDYFYFFIYYEKFVKGPTIC